MYLTDNDRGLIIRALTKVLENEQHYARADEYKKLLARLKHEQQTFADPIFTNERFHDMDEV